MGVVVVVRDPECKCLRDGRPIWWHAAFNPKTKVLDGASFCGVPCASEYVREKHPDIVVAPNEYSPRETDREHEERVRNAGDT